MDAKPARIVELHRLRGVAILMIVATHAYQAFDLTAYPFAAALLEDTFDDSSVLFIFIAGFLFQYLSERKFSVAEYFSRKTINVLLPYLIALSPALLYPLIRGGMTFSDPALSALSSQGLIVTEIIYPGLTMNYALWFIPVMVIYYVLAPVLRSIDKQHAYWIMWILLPLSLLMHRPTYSSGHNLSLALYFLSAYVFGMFCSHHRVRATEFLDKYLGWLSTAFLIVFAAHLFLSDHHGKSQTPEPFLSQGGDGLIDWLFLQKLLMTVVLLGLVRRVREGLGQALDFLAAASFTIFFYHLYVEYALSWTNHFIKPEFDLARFLGNLGMAILIPCLLALLARQFVPKWSRQLVGVGT